MEILSLLFPVSGGEDGIWVQNINSLSDNRLKYEFCTEQRIREGVYSKTKLILLSLKSVFAIASCILIYCECSALIIT